MATTPKKKNRRRRKERQSLLIRQERRKEREGDRQPVSSRKAPAKRPIRREVTGVVFLIWPCACFSAISTRTAGSSSCCPRRSRALFGFGYFLVAPALAAASWILLTHKGRPVALRTASALLVPISSAGCGHCSSAGRISPAPKACWASCGPPAGSSTAAAFSPGPPPRASWRCWASPPPVVIFCVLILVLLMVVFQISFSTLWQMWKSGSVWTTGWRTTRTRRSSSSPWRSPEPQSPRPGRPGPVRPGRRSTSPWMMTRRPPGRRRAAYSPASTSPGTRSR